MNKIILSSCLLFIGLFVNAQSVQTYSADTAKVNSLIEQSKQFFVSDPDKAISLSTEAKNLAEQINFQIGLAYALKNIGVSYYYKSKHVEALDYYEQSLHIFQTLNDNVGIANLLSNIGVIYYDRGDDTKALEYYLQSLRYAELAGNKLRVLSALTNVGGVYFIKEQTYDKALQYYLQALTLSEELNDKQIEGKISVNVGTIYFLRKAGDKGKIENKKNDDDTALTYFKKALNAFDTEGSLHAYNAIGKLHLRQKEFDLALKNYNTALLIAKSIDNKMDMVVTLTGLGNVYKVMNDYTTAINYYQKAEPLAVELEASHELEDIYKEMASAFAKKSDYANGFKYQSLYSEIREKIYNEEQDKKLATIQFGYDLDKKQNEINLLTKDKSIQDLQLRREKTFKNALSIGLVMVLVIILVLFRDYRLKIRTNKLLDKQKVQIEGLLLNILPQEVANELQTTGKSTPRNYESVSVLFTDFKSFTTLADKMEPDEVVKELNTCFIAFDDIIEKHNLEKIKTIGDAYMCAGGIPTPHDDHVFDMVRASLEIQEFIYQNNRRREEEGQPPWEIRIGINVGPVVAGVVGKKKYAYDIWGSAVNIASRMESSGMPGQVNISSAVYEIIKDKYACIHRGKIYAKNVGEVDMYFIDHEIEKFEGFKNFEELTTEDVEPQPEKSMQQGELLQ